ncbi:non-ribosomal peptide synthetase [Gordonia jinghuaiqii]|nr:non-ribosomal peptide synthetase [Gordonia jinghuaiqii]
MNDSPASEMSTPDPARRFALSAAQRSLWFTQQAAPDVPINVAQYVEIDGPIDAELFLRATSAAVQGAKFTQLRFEETESGLVGIHDPSLHYWPDIIDLRDRADPRAAAEAMMEQDYSRALDPRVDRTARGCLFRLAEEKYLLYIRGHHLLSDGMGGKDRTVEALATYHSAVTGEPAPKVAPVDLDLPARADAEYRGSTRFDTDRAYWRETMSGVGIPATLAHRQGRPAAVARRVAGAVPEDTMARLRQVAQERSTILPNVLVAAFAAYLGRAAAQGDEVIFQFPVAARTTAALRATPLPVANIVPLRTRVTGEATVIDALRTTQAALMGALRHQRFRGEDIWADVAADEASGATPRTAAQERSGPMLNLMLFDREFPCGQATATFHILTVGPADDLTINIYPVPGDGEQPSLMIGVEANPNRYDDAEVGQHHRQFLAMLDTFTDALLRAPESRIDDLPLYVPPAGGGELTSTSPRPDTVPQALAAAAARHGRSLAVETAGASSTRQMLPFDRLAGRARDLAARLHTLGARPGTAVAIALAPGIDRLVAWWAVATSGAAVVLLDPQAPHAVTDEMVDASRPLFVIADGDTPGMGGSGVAVRTLADIAETAPSTSAPGQPTADDVACYVAVRGGRASRAGVVAVPQRALAALLDQGVFDSAATDLGYGRLAFGASDSSWAAHLELIAAAAHGLRLVDRSADHDTHVIVTPGDLLGIAGSGTPGDGDAIRATTVLVVGEDLAPAPTVRLAFGRDVFTPYFPLGALGPYTLPGRISPDTSTDRPLASGPPRPGVDIAVLDHRLRRVPDGVAGDIYVAGQPLPQCFTGEPGRTAAGFVACPWRPGERMIATGDRGHLDPGTGTLVVDHRAAEVVPVNGARVDLAALERAAAEVAGVAWAVVVSGPGADADIDVGVVLEATADGAGPVQDARRVRAAVRRRVNAEVPAVARPRRVVVLDAVPTDRSGNIDRGTVARLIDATPDTYAAHRDPETPTEVAVAGALTDVLGVARPSMNDELVQLGATSLGFLQLATHLGDSLGVVVNVRDLADVTTPAELAAVIDAAAPRRLGGSGSVSYRPTRAQHEIWLLNRADRRASVYHLAVRLTLAPDVSAHAARAALIDVAARHEALRTVYPDVDGEPVASVRDEVEARAAAPITSATLDSTGTEIAVSAPFDLTVDAPWRAVIDATGERTELVLVAHHIAIDEWSLHIMVEDFAHAVRARTAGVEPVWTDEAPGFSAALQARGVAETPAAETSAAEIFWTRTMRNAPAGLSLPEPARAAPGGLTAGPATYRHRLLGRDVREAAVARATHAGTTLNTLLCVALSATLAEYCDTDDIVMSMPVSGRFTTEELRPVGMFVETVPVRTVGIRRSGVDEALATVGKDLAGAIAHADAAPTGLADVIFAYHASRPDPAGSDVFDRVQTIPTGEARTALEFSLIDDEQGLSLTLTIAENRVDPVAAEHLLDRFVETVAALGSAAPPDRIARCVPAGSLSPRAGDGQRRTAPVDPVDALVRRAALAPDFPAVVAGEQRLSYGGLVERARAIASELGELGVRPGDRVALIMGRGADTVVAMIGTLMADAVYVPIDPDHPQSRIDLILATTAPAALIEDGPTVSIGVGMGVAQPIPGAAYVIHTSGSTGVPKAVMVTRRNLAAMLGAALHAIGATGEDVWSWTHSYAFDFSVWEILGALAAGGTVVAVEQTAVRDPRLLASALDRHGVTVLSQTPTAFALLTDPTVRVPEPPASLRAVVFGGEALAPATLRTWAAEHPDVRLVNMYGITETTVHLTAVDVDVDDERSHVGAPLDGADVMVLDRELRPVPHGAVGELYVVGDQLALGYHNASGLTATRFVADPAGGGRRMYRTGDRVREIAPGSLIYLGRNDDQVQIRGYRIELGEIVAVLRGIPGVGDARVLVDQGRRAGDERLLAFVTEDGLADFDVLDGLDEESILTACAERLPAHTVPARLAIVDGWPMTSTGKLDRHKLIGVLAENSAARSRALSPDEQVVATAMGAVTGSDTTGIGADTNFFAAGGTSLSAARLAATLAGMGHRVSVADVFDAPTVAELAARIHDELQLPDTLSASTSAHARSRPADHRDVSEQMPLTPEQMDLWLRWRTEPDFTGYLMPLALPVEASPADTRRALAQIVTRHDALRTSFVVRERVPVQNRWSDADVLAHLDAQLGADARRLSAGDVADELGAMLGPIDLATSLPWRLRLREVDGVTWLLVVVHHIAVDGESFPILAAELDAALGGTLPASHDVDYRHYSAWRQATLADRHEELVAHWKSAFARPVEPLRLPEVNLQAATDAHAGGDVTVHRAHAALDETTTTALDDLAVVRRTTPFIVAHTALAAVLARQGNTDVVTVGTALSGRIDPQLIPVPGLFARAVPLHTPVDLDISFDALIAAVTAVDLGAFAHADLPLTEITEIADPRRAGAGTPLFEVSFGAVPDEVVAAGLLGSETPVAGSSAPGTSQLGSAGAFGVPLFGVDVSMYRRDGALHLTMACTDTVATADRLEALCGLVVETLRLGVADPERPVVSLLAPESSVHTGQPARRQPETLGTLLSGRPVGAGAAEAHTVAVVDRRYPVPGYGPEIGRADFDRLSTSLARVLVEHGIGAGDVVVALLPRSVFGVLATAAIARAGAAFVNIDPADPPERRRMIIDRCRPAAVFTLAGASDVEVTAGTPVWAVDELISETTSSVTGEPFDDDQRVRPVSLDDIAYITFTSGTTGTPKGVQVTHRGLADWARDTVDRLRLTPDDRVLHTYATGFDAHLMGVVPPRIVGATIVLCPPEVIAADELADLVDAEDVTVLLTTPSVLATLRPEELPQVRHVAVGGEPLGTALVREWARDRALSNEYGPTEATVAVSSARYAGDSSSPAGPVHIGRELAGVTMHVLDSALRPVPDHTVGELYLAGNCLARGYLDDPATTAAAFVADPTGPGRRMYRTGDLVHRRADGTYVIHGRTDDQVKIRGIRLEPAEIDAALSGLPGVATSVTGTRTTAAGEKILVSWVVGDTAAGSGLDELPAQLSHILPRSMIPGAFVAVPDLPIGRNGKIDMAALPDPDLSGPTADGRPGAGRAPAGMTEELVAAVWAEVLGRPAESMVADSDFFAEGGTSLSATQVTSRLSSVTGAEIGVRTLFEARTISGVAGRVAELLDDPDTDQRRSSPAPARLPVPEQLPLAYPQRRMWIHHHIDPRSTAYHVPVVLRFHGRVDLARLRKAVDEVVGAHAVLRTVYPDSATGPLQRRIEHRSPVLRHRVVDAAAGPHGLEEQITDYLRRPFDLENETGFRAAVFEVEGAEDSELYLAAVLHHIAIDGWSVRVLLADLIRAYEGERLAVPADEAFTYADFTQWQLHRLGDPSDPAGRYARELRFWTSTLGDAPGPLRLPGRRDVDTTGVTGRIHGSIDGTESLRQTAKSLSATVFQVAHAALTAVIGQWTGEWDTVIGVPVHGRHAPEWESVVGMFVNTVALRTRLRPDAPIREFVEQARNAALAALPHSEVPYEDVARTVRPDAREGVDPLITVLLVNQDVLPQASGDIVLSGVSATLLSEATTTVDAKFDVEVVLAEHDDELHITVVHSGHIPAQVARALLDDFRAMLLAAAEDPDQVFPVAAGNEFGTAATPVDSESSVVAAVDAAVDAGLTDEIATIMADVLGGGVPGTAAPEVGDTDDFFTLGGTSLSATRVTSALGRHLGIRIPTRLLFEHPTPAALAGAVSQLDREQATDTGAPGHSRAGTPVAGDTDSADGPLAPTQRRMWVGAQMLGQVAIYAVPVVVPVPAGIAESDVVTAVETVIGRHPALRTRYLSTPAGPRQRVLDGWRPVVRQLDAAVLAAAVLDAPGEESGAAAQVMETLAAPFDLAGDPPVRAWLVTGRTGHGIDGPVAVIIVAHHIALDGESAAIVASELGELLAGEELGPAPVGFDVIARRMAVEEDRTRPELLDHWRHALEGYSGELDLAQRRPEQRDLRTSMVEYRLTNGAAQAVSSTARRARATDFHVLHAATVLALAAQAGSDDIAVATPASLRRDADSAATVGMLISTVVLRTRVAPDATVGELIERVRDDDLAALDHAAIALDDVVALVDPPRVPGRHPLVQVAFSVVEPESAGVMPSPDFAAVGAGFDQMAPRSEFDLHIVAVADSGGWRIQLHHARDLFDESVIRGLGERVVAAVEAVTGDPSCRVAAIEPLTEAERAFVLRRAEPASTTDAEPLLGELLTDAVAAFPDRPAIADGTRTLTYRELDAWVSVTARALIARGLGARQAVAVVVPRSVESVVAIWAVSRIGGICVPVDVTYPAARIDHVIAGARATAIGPSDIPPQPPKDQSGHVVPEPVTRVSRDDLAYIITTSGTTGTPNIVGVTHRGVHRVASLGDVEPSDRVGMAISPGFDATLHDMLLPLAAGATLVVVPAEVSGGRDLSRFLDDTGVSVFTATPSVMQTLQPGAITSLRLVYIGGEALPADLAAAWSGHAQVMNIYGPTETTVTVSTSAYRDGDPIRLGHPRPGIGAEVLDTRLRHVPPGVVGELYISGTGLARGYLGDPESTAATFVAGPEGRRRYRTGDLVRWDRDTGELVYLGRADRQVKIRGQRVEPAEIDAVIVRAGARRSVTVLRKGPVGPALVSYVVSPVPADDLAAECRAVLPRHMVPSRFIEMDGLPLTGAGKIDEKRLPEPVWSSSAREPENPLETAVLESFRTVLADDETALQVGMDDDFFAAGGNSLALLVLRDELARRTGMTIDAARLFTCRTPAEIARALEAGTAGEPGPLARRVVPLSRTTLPDSVTETDSVTGRRVVWCVHTAAGTVEPFRALGESLRSAAAFGLQLPELVLADRELPSTLDEIAALHVAALRQAQPKGPYTLVGWSLGGLIAHEVARRLVDAGEQVATLMILDSRTPAELREVGDDELLPDDHPLRAAAEQHDPQALQRFEDRTRAMAAAARAYDLRPIGVGKVIYVAADDNPDSTRWMRAVEAADGTSVEVMTAGTTHAELGHPDVMRRMARRIEEEW